MSRRASPESRARTAARAKEEEGLYRAWHDPDFQKALWAFTIALKRHQDGDPEYDIEFIAQGALGTLGRLIIAVGENVNNAQD